MMVRRVLDRAEACASLPRLGRYTGHVRGIESSEQAILYDDVLTLLREIELLLAACDDVASAFQSIEISAARYHSWRKRFAGICPVQLLARKCLKRENALLKKTVAEPELYKLTFKESVNHRKFRE